MKEFITCLKKYADFSGRARRREFWMFYLWSFIFAIVILIGSAILNMAFDTDIFIILYLMYAFAIVIPYLAVYVRRLHDTDRSAWCLLISLVPFVGEITLFVFTLLDSDIGTNDYGQTPKSED